METRKRTRKAFPFNRKILEKYQKGKCKDCSVLITIMDTAITKNARPLSEKEVARMLEGSPGDAGDSRIVSSPRTETRLRKKENGMVLLPRSFYNEHPAKRIMDEARKSATKRKIDVGTPIQRNGTPVKQPKNSNITHIRSPVIQKENEPSGRSHRDYTRGKPGPGRPKKLNGLKAKNNNNDTEYHLIFVDPAKSIREKTKTQITKLSLSDLLNTEKLPSKIWEIERIPPILVNNKSDLTYNTIAAELDALMADHEQPKPVEDIPILPENVSNIELTKIIDAEVTSDNQNISNEIANIDTTDLKDNETTAENNAIENISIIDDLSKTEPVDEVMMEIDDSAVISAAAEDITSFCINNSSNKDVEHKDDSEVLKQEDSQINKQEDKLPEEIDETREIILDNTAIAETHKDISISKETPQKSSDITNEDCASTVIDNCPNQEEAVKVDMEKVNEEFPSIMDLLNESTSEQDDQKDAHEEPSVSIEIVSQIKPVVDNIEPEVKLPEIKPEVESGKPHEDIKDMTKILEDKMEESLSVDSKDKTSEGCDDTITSVVFRRFSADDQTYDRLVIFQADLEYTVKINNKEVELLGAPKYMSSTEDLQILLQIVDEVSLDSFNVICKR